MGVSPVLVRIPLNPKHVPAVDEIEAFETIMLYSNPPRSVCTTAVYFFMTVVLCFPLTLQAQGNFKLLESAGRDPLRACSETKGSAATHSFKNNNRQNISSKNNSGKYNSFSSGQTRQAQYLTRELGRLIPRLEEKHRHLTRIYPELNRRIVFVRKNSAPEVHQGMLVQNKQFLNAYYNANGRLSCLVLDARRYNLQRADRWTRRILRLDFQGGGPRMEFETLARGTRVLSRDARIGPRARIKILRLANRHIRNLIYAAEFITAEHARRKGIIRANERRTRDDRTILRRARGRP